MRRAQLRHWTSTRARALLTAAIFEQVCRPVLPFALRDPDPHLRRKALRCLVALFAPRSPTGAAAGVAEGALSPAALGRATPPMPDNCPAQ